MLSQENSLAESLVAGENRRDAMRICHVIEACGGVGQVVIDLAREGLAAGDDITVITASSQVELFRVIFNA
jgi:hypothetical protein